jgi:hypothetical protein
MLKSKPVLLSFSPKKCIIKDIKLAKKKDSRRILWADKEMTVLNR